MACLVMLLSLGASDVVTLRDGSTREGEIELMGRRDGRMAVVLRRKDRKLDVIRLATVQEIRLGEGLTLTVSVGTATASAEEQTGPARKGRVLPHRIVSTKDVSHGRYVYKGTGKAVAARTRVRCNILILAEKNPTADELKAVGEQVWKPIKEKHDEVFLFFWLPDQKVGEQLAYATADYTRGGLTEFALQDKADGWEPLAKSAKGQTLTEARKRIVFRALVKAQDDGIGDVKAYSVVAARHGLDEAIVRKIAVEGALNRWPMK